MSNGFDFQFYPTPAHLASKAWAKFRNREFIRVLEPSAGNGDLIKGMPNFGDRRGRDVKVDCCEKVQRQAQIRWNALENDALRDSWKHELRGLF